MKTVIGLGNPGARYAANRHNAGHMFVDFLAEKKIASIRAVNTDCFMNLSGGFVKKYTNAHNIKPEGLYIAHDDLDIPLGSFKIQHATGPKVHNGIASVEDALGDGEFWRIRIGVDARQNSPVTPRSGESYVLSDFSPDERATLDQTFARILTRLTG